MKLLALDTATPYVAVATWDGVHGREYVSDAPMKHGEQVAPLIAAALAAAGWAPADLTGIVVGVGPGPFTGLRVGLVTARTMGFALGIPVSGVCTLDVLALEADRDDAFAVATDARRREVYFAAYDRGRRVRGPEVLKPADVAFDGPVVGEGAVLYPDQLGAALPPLRPSAVWLARAAAEGLAEILPPEPLYLRRPDAVEAAKR